LSDAAKLLRKEIMKKIVALTLPVFLFACAQPSLTGDTYSRNEAGVMQDVRYGTVTSVRYVKLEGSSTGGTILGAVAGGLLGRTIGSGSGRDLATAGGAIAGAAAGSHAGQALNSRQGVELNVDLDGGGKIAVVQEATKRETFSVGDRVRVLNSGARARVTH
jgi:outer membrane lipoprotein SlyB